MIQTLCPELSIVPATLACFLSPVSEDTSEFSLTVLIKCHAVNIAFIAKLWELSYGFQKVVIGVERIGVREPLIPLSLSKEFLDSKNIGCILVHVTDVAVITSGRPDSALCNRVIRVRYSICDTNMLIFIVPVFARPDTILLDCCFSPAGEEGYARACKKLSNVAFNHFVEFCRVSKI